MQADLKMIMMCKDTLATDSDRDTDFAHCLQETTPTGNNVL